MAKYDNTDLSVPNNKGIDILNKRRNSATTTKKRVLKPTKAVSWKRGGEVIKKTLQRVTTYQEYAKAVKAVEDLKAQIPVIRVVKSKNENKAPSYFIEKK